jgi:hypothetical protein
MVAHTCNSNYSGGRNQEDSGSRQVQVKVSKTSISTNKPAMVDIPVIPVTQEA